MEEGDGKCVAILGRVYKQGNHWIGSVETAADEWVVVSSTTRSGVFDLLGKEMAA